MRTTTAERQFQRDGAQFVAIGVPEGLSGRSTLAARGTNSALQRLQASIHGGTMQLQEAAALRRNKRWNTAPKCPGKILKEQVHLFPSPEQGSPLVPGVFLKPIGPVNIGCVSVGTLRGAATGMPCGLRRHDSRRCDRPRQPYDARRPRQSMRFRRRAAGGVEDRDAARHITTYLSIRYDQRL